MQGGLTTADRIVAVSPGYAAEIQTPEGGWGLEGMINSRNYILSGVLNGESSSKVQQAEFFMPITGLIRNAICTAH